MLTKLVDWATYWPFVWRLLRFSMRPVEPGRVLGRSEHGWLLVAGRRGSGVERVPVSPRPEGRGLEVMN